MTLFGRTISRTVIAIVGVAIIIAITLAVPSCLSKWQSERAQSRVDTGQAGAASESAGDAINTFAASGERERASDDLTRDNGRDIRNAPGAGDRVNSGVDLAGRRALCSRKAYANDPRCKGVGK